MKHRAFYVDVVRCCACLLVVSSHVFAPVCAGMNDYSHPIWWVFNLFDSLIRPSAALFIMISGKIFLGSSRDESYMRFVWKRYSKVILPFFVWSMIYAFFEASEHEVPLTFGNAILQFLRGPTEYHLWFMYLILALYLLMPWMRRFARPATPAALTAALVLWMGFLVAEFARPDVIPMNFVTRVISYGGFALLGYALDKISLSRRAAIYSLLGCLGVILFNAAGTYLLTNQDGGILNEKLYFGAAPLVALQGGLMFLLLKKFDEESVLYKMSWLRSWISKLGRHSYNVYLSHAIFIWLLANGVFGFSLSHETGPNAIIGVALTSAGVMAFSLGFSLLLQKIPMVSRFFVISTARDVQTPLASPPFTAFSESSQS